MLLHFEVKKGRNGKQTACCLQLLHLLLGLKDSPQQLQTFLSSLRELTIKRFSRVVLNNCSSESRLLLLVIWITIFTKRLWKFYSELKYFSIFLGVWSGCWWPRDESCSDNVAELHHSGCRKHCSVCWGVQVCSFCVDQLSHILTNFVFLQLCF